MIIESSLPEGSEALAQAAQTSCEYLISGCVQGQFGGGPGKCSRSSPTHGKGIQTGWPLRSLPTRTAVWFCEITALSLLYHVAYQRKIQLVESYFPQGARIEKKAPQNISSPELVWMLYSSICFFFFPPSQLCSTRISLSINWRW